MAPRGRIFDEMAKLMTDAAGVAQGVRREAETAVKTQAERLLASMDVVSREEFEAVRDMAALARDENEALKRRLAALEGKLAAAGPEAANANGGPGGQAGAGSASKA
jgi:BMFP domain-containing protein YqiC